MAILNTIPFVTISFHVDTTKEFSSTWLIIEENFASNKTSNYPPSPRVWFGTDTSFFFGLAYNLQASEGVYEFDLISQPVTHDIVRYAGKETRLKVGEMALGECPRRALTDIMDKDSDCGVKISKWTSDEIIMESRPEPSGAWDEVMAMETTVLVYNPETKFDGSGIIYGMGETGEVDYLRSNPIVLKKRGLMIEKFYREAEKPHYAQTMNISLFTSFWHIHEAVELYNRGLVLIEKFPPKLTLEMVQEKVDHHFPKYGGKVQVIISK